MYLIYDTETTGLPKDWDAPVSDLKNWPRLVQLAWLVMDDEGKTIKEVDETIYPSGFRIPKKASAVHGISTEKALEVGKDLRLVLTEFLEDVHSGSTLVAHNIAFDDKIVGAEILRLGLESSFFLRPRICTMLESISYCQIPGKFKKYKRPSLTQLHQHLFQEGFSHAHNAMADVRACARCFWELKQRKVI